ncbi:DUF1642 domain-containing protein [Lacticaseibacillus paracasei]|uniref:DUF1642 domain-containing protein n=1 Tax=Lacticaseibacillus paracasei TaxID=1597 RepID=UPI0021A2AE7D|nr:DUF1642 domain-containing protein [Lacticaseibacillus paracasei]MCT2893688.1 DUF1642 domain-containing protein [Lacticaseibacillus paracasei]
MSEEKLYAVKTDKGKWLNQYYFWGPETWARPDKDDREKVAKHYGGHVVTFVQEPKKVVLSKEQAQIVEDAHDSEIPATFISRHSDGEELLMNAYVNGYTVAKEKKYNVKVPQTQTSYYYKGSDGHVHASDTSGGLDNQFSDYELQQYGLDGERFTKEEVTDDEEV